MIDEALDRLRESNPVPSEVTPPSIESLLARIEAEGYARARRHLRSRMAAGVVPVLAAAAAIAVAVVAIAALGHHRQSPTVPPSHTSVGPRIPLPKHGMQGVVGVEGATLLPRGVETISLEQCFPCAAGTPAGQHRDTWRLTSTNGGLTWSAQRTTWLGTAQFSGPEDGWADGSTQPLGAGAGRAYVTHDGGRSWTVAGTPAGWSVGGISVAGGTVWAVAIRWPDGRCGPGESCTDVLRGPAAGSSLARVSSQPVAGLNPPLIAAAGADTAYIDAARGINRVRHVVTHDGGRTWQTLPKFCPYEGADRTLSVDGARSLWRFCWNSRAPVLLGRSTDGGHTYRSYHVPAPGPRGAPLRFDAVSSEVAWEMTDHGDVIRITRGGAHAAVVWWQSRSQVSTVNGIPEALTVRDANTAYVTVVVGSDRRAHTTGSYIVIYATHDGGRTWTTQEVVPPRG